MKVSRSLTHWFGPRSNFGLKLAMGGVLYECKVMSCDARNGNVWADGLGGGVAPAKLLIDLIGEWTSSENGTVFSGDSATRGETFLLPVLAVVALGRGRIFGMTVYPSVCKVKSYVHCICVAEIPVAHAMTWNSVSDGCGIAMLNSLDRLGWGGVVKIVVVEKIELDRCFDDTCGVASFCNL
jgi:hypothetical protein